MQDYPDDRILQESVAVFLQNDWSIGNQMQGMVQLEKSKFLAAWIIVVVILLFALLGAIIIAVARAVMGKEKVTLQLRPDGQLQVMGSKASFSTTDPYQVIPIAESVKTTMGWGAIIGLTFISFVLNFILLSALS